MATFKNGYRGFKIVITEVNADRVDYFVQRADGTTLEDSEGYCVTVEEAMETCKETIDDWYENE